MVDCVTEVTWLQQHLGEICVFLPSVPTVYWDNISATYLTLNIVFHARTEYIELDVHFVWERVASGHLQVWYLPTDDQIADIFTKGRLSYSHHKLVCGNLSFIALA